MNSRRAKYIHNQTAFKLIDYASDIERCYILPSRKLLNNFMISIVIYINVTIINYLDGLHLPILTLSSFALLYPILTMVNNWTCQAPVAGFRDKHTLPPDTYTHTYIQDYLVYMINLHVLELCEETGLPRGIPRSTMKKFSCWPISLLNSNYNIISKLLFKNVSTSSVNKIRFIFNGFHSW